MRARRKDMRRGQGGSYLVFLSHLVSTLPPTRGKREEREGGMEGGNEGRKEGGKKKGMEEDRTEL